MTRHRSVEVASFLATAFLVAVLTACDSRTPRGQQPHVANVGLPLSGGAQWRQVAGPSPRSSSRAMAYDSVRGKVWLFMVSFETTADFTSGANLWEWDGTRWTLRAVGGPGEVHHRSAMVYDSRRDRLVLYGGESGEPYETWEWDGATWAVQTPPEPTPPDRTDGVMAFDSARGKVVLFGSTSPALSDTWEWDGERWEQRGVSGPAPQPGGPMAYDAARAKTVLFSAGSTWEWDGTTWAQRAPATSPGSARAMAYDSTRQRIVLFGGEPNETWEWDGENWVERMPAVNPSASDAVMAYDGARGKVVLFGWDVRHSEFETWEWDGVLWTPRIRSPSRRADAAMAYDEARGEVVLFGGDFVGDTWTWDGVIWERRLPEGPTPPAGGHVMTYDRARQRILVYAGASGTWTWDGVAWEQRTVMGPTGISLSMTYDDARGTVIAFGSDTLGRAETWEWDGATWTQLIPPNSPPADNWWEGMAYDSARERAVLISSMIGASEPVTTWEWDGNDWSQRFPEVSPETPGGISGVGMAYDSARGKVVVVGGSRYVSSVWEWDGTNWERSSGPGGPSARQYPALAYDSRRRVMVLFGGTNFSFSPSRPEFGDTWEIVLPPCGDAGVDPCEAEVEPDAGATDAGATDSGATDAGATDAGVTDAGSEADGGGHDPHPGGKRGWIRWWRARGFGCSTSGTSSGEGGWMILVLAGLLARRRRV